MQLIAEANRPGIKSHIQHNVEFLDHMNRHELPRPTMFLSPSAWHLDVMEAKFPGLGETAPAAHIPAGLRSGAGLEYWPER